MDKINRNKEENIITEGCIQKATKIINKTAAKLENNFKRSNTVKVLWSINNINKLLLTIVIMLLQIVPLTTIMAAPAPAPAPIPVPLPLALAQPKPHQKPQQKYHNIHLSNSLSKLLDEDIDIDNDDDDNLSIDPIKQSNSLLNLLGSQQNQKSIESKISSTESNKKKKKHRIRSLYSDQSDMPWQNPCGGRFNGNVVNKNKRITIQIRRKAFKHLRDAIGLDYYHDALSGTINISDISDWSKPAENYRFLAEIRPRSNITLVRWHKKMQRYVGIISYLTKTQQRTHHHSRKINDNDHSTELEQMFQASKKVLCAIETAINSTQNQPKIQRTTKFEMQTYIHQLRSKNNYINEIDLKIVKSKYINITKNMRKALNTKIKDMRCKIQERRISSLDTDSTDNASISIFNNSNNISNSASNSNSKENNSMSLSNQSSSNSRSREFKRSRDCQRILNKQNHQNNKRLSNNLSNRNRKSGERSV